MAQAVCADLGSTPVVPIMLVQLWRSPWVGRRTHRPSPGSSHLTYRDVRIELLKEAVDVLDVARMSAGQFE
jgi:hypothetical protein